MLRPSELALTWAGFGEAGRALARSVADDGYRPDVVLAVARGGVLLAGSLSYALDVKTMHLVNVEFYTGVNARLESPVLLPPTPQPAGAAAATGAAPVRVSPAPAAALAG